MNCKTCKHLDRDKQEQWNGKYWCPVKEKFMKLTDKCKEYEERT